MKILVINAGSSSLKYQLIDMDGEVVVAKGLCERIGIDGRFTHKTGDGRVVTKEVAMPDHTAAFEQVKLALTEGEGKVIDSLSEVSAIGHRVVQGGSKYDKSVRIDAKVLADIEGYSSLAPLHNPAHVQGINAAVAAFGKDVPQVAVFDTAFHQTMPAKAYMFGVPYEYYQKYGIRRYGFHGTSHRFVSARCCELLGKPDGKGTRIITCHLGNGSSIAAIKDGKVVDTTMGLTPLEGLVMGTRSGDIDPAIIFHLHDTLGMSVDAINKLLTKESGLLGLTEVTSDCRYVEDNYATKEDAKRAMDVYCHRLAKYIGAYTALMDGRLDAVVFTGGIGENAAMVRELSLGKLGVLGFEVDHERNLAARFGKSGFINKEGTRPAVVIPTNEELVIAQDASRLTA